VFSRSAIVAGRQRVSAKLAKDGMADANVLPLTKVDLDKKTIDLTFEIEAP
jgi:outer membrane protein assembly factor BamA